MKQRAANKQAPSDVQVLERQVNFFGRSALFRFRAGYILMVWDPEEGKDWAYELISMGSERIISQHKTGYLLIRELDDLQSVNINAFVC